jgi:transposase-like protein
MLLVKENNPQLKGNTMANTAKVRLAAVYADCPVCGGSLADEGGSHCIPVNWYSKDQRFACDDCGREFRLEAKAWK